MSLAEKSSIEIRSLKIDSPGNIKRSELFARKAELAGAASDVLGAPGSLQGPQTPSCSY